MEPCTVNLKKVLAALDLSDYAETTFLHALTLAKALSAELIIVNVINTRGLDQLDQLAALGYDISTEKYLREATQLRRATFEKDYLSRVGRVPVRLLIMAGDPADLILKTIREEDAGLVVMATKGRTALASVLMGSVAEKVFHRATCPVVSVRGPEHCLLP